MSLIDNKCVVEFFKRMGIRLKGSLRTVRLRKKRQKHLEEGRMMIWARCRKRYWKSRNESERPYVKGKTTVLGMPLQVRR